MSDLRVQQIRYTDGSARFAPLAGQRGAVFLDGGDGRFADSGIDIISAWPRAVVELSAGQAPAADIFDALAALTATAPAGARSLPFVGGLIGYLGYDLNRALETIGESEPPRIRLPTVWVGRYDWALVQDHGRRRAWLIANGAAGRAALSRYCALRDTTPPAAAPFRLTSPLVSNMSRAQYLAAAARVIDYIHAGDCYQVNLAQCFSAGYRGDPWALYQQMRRRLPAPFAAFVNTGAGCLLSASPERFLQIAGRSVQTSPIKGTRPRGDTAEADAAAATALLESAKDRAENLMIVDLLRNDLGRSCVPGSIAVDRLFELKSFANVHHLVSTVRATLRPDVTPLAALAAAFPGGSITGAPKIRAMQIIGELEREPRSGYCGSVFYLSDNGRLDSNIAIRSVMTDGDTAACWGGGGIVADSDPVAEYAETLTKIEPLLAALRGDV